MRQNQSNSLKPKCLCISGKQSFLVVHRLKTAGKQFLIRGTPITCRMDSVEQTTDSGSVCNLFIVFDLLFVI